MEKISQHFRLDEFIYSRIAVERGIDNTPPPEAVERIKKLTNELLEPLRERYGQPMHITSGYRCDELNRRVGGFPLSLHRRGEAADVYVTDPQTFIRLLLTEGSVYDQAIWYRKRNFFHLSLKSEGENRGIYQEKV